MFSSNRRHGTNLKARFSFFVSGVNYGHILFIEKGTGRIWGFGKNDVNQLSISDEKSRYFAPAVLKELEFLFGKVVTIQTGYKHSMILTTDNECYGLGRNGFGQLCNGNARGVSMPSKVQFENNRKIMIKDVKCGYDHNVYLCEDGVYSGGDNRFSQIGNNSSTDTFVAVKIKVDHKNVEMFGCGGYFSIFLMRNHSIIKTGQISNEGVFRVPTVLSGFKNDLIFDFSCGVEHFFAIGNKNVYGMGLDSSSQIGLKGKDEEVKVPTVVSFLKNKNVEDIQCGLAHTLIRIKDDGTYAFGSKLEYFGAKKIDQLKGHSNIFKINVDFEIFQMHCGYYESFLFDPSGNLYSCGLNDSFQCALNHDKVVMEFTRTMLVKNVELKGGYKALFKTKPDHPKFINCIIKTSL